MSAIMSVVTGHSFEKSSACLEPSVSARPWRSAGSGVASAIAACSGDCTEAEAAECCAASSDDEDMDHHLVGFRPQSLRPAPRGSRQCLCLGEVLFMCGHYGWLTTDSSIEHPSAGKNGGRIYIHQSDVATGVTLIEGDRVVFYLYVDDQGLGAEDCRLQDWGEHPQSAAARPASALSMNPNAAVFVPTGVPTATRSGSQPSAVAAAAAWAAPPAIQAPPGIRAPPVAAFAFNEAYWSDSSDDDSDDSGAEVLPDLWADGDVESNGEQSESEAEDKEVCSGGIGWQGAHSTIPRRGAARGTKARKSKTSMRSSGSSSTSVPSDSDGPMPPPPPPGLRHPNFRPPPGLSLL